MACGEPAAVEDLDGDGYAAPADCNDHLAAVNPGAVELCLNGIDDDCDGIVDDDDRTTWFHDADGDGFGVDSDTIEACAAPRDHVDVGGDCDDANARSNPGMTETDGTCDGFDNDCDGVVDEDPNEQQYWPDNDGDGYGRGTVLMGCQNEPPDGYADNWDDCDDSDPEVHPGAEDPPYDGLDADCDGWSDYDADRDGHVSDAHGGDDCDDSAGGVNPGRVEDLGDEIDEDCAPDVMVLVSTALASSTDLDLGSSVAWIGEIAAGAPGDSTTGADAGAVYLLTADLATRATIVGAADDELGVALAAAEGGLWAGGSGSAWWFNTPIASGDVDDAACTVTGDASKSFGRSLAAGDLDDDGTDDLVVGAGHDGTSAYKGAAYVFHGLCAGFVASEAADATVLPATGARHVGSFVRIADLDGDGADDFVTRSDSYQGSVFFGPLSGDLTTADADATVEGGWVWEAGDFDGDGQIDLASGMVSDDALVLLGPLPAGASTRTDAHAVLSLFGANALAVSDVNADGVDDFAMSTASTLERTHVVVGPVSGAVDVRYDADGFLGDSRGASLEGADVDGDGAGDLIVGTPNNAYGGVSLLLGVR
jgi:hypothetical protein